MSRLGALMAAAICAGAAAPALAATPPYVTVRFDLLSPAGTRCQVPGTAPASGGDLLGRPYLRGLPVDRAVICTAADGRGFGLNTLRDPRDPLAGRVDVIIVDRAGKAVPMVMVQADSQDDPLPIRGNATSLAPAVR
ncbi:hypothetical protein [Paracoccus contaminans]|uniref:Uncharacterized protein n=1 Tax=Paracoccus contaminans TaxID=1945662 RepID=A0A1W6CUF4_9RHOB|nr:hypothetical protein [Paracoccus contaminans]ARJ68498.1 hypothetical protein B0A89_01380 [Paracoccus contaminans]